MTKEQIVTAGSEVLWHKGVRILQGNRLAATDEEHADELARHMDLCAAHNVADMGCGFGEMSRLLVRHFPLALFWLINKDDYQLEKCLELDGPFIVVKQDICSTNLAGGIMDLVMFNYSLCLVDARAALKEAARIAAPNGRLFVYDYERTGGNNSITQEHLFADFLTDDEFRWICWSTGWNKVETIHPGGDDTLFREASEDHDLYDLMFRYLVPVIWKAQR